MDDYITTDTGTGIYGYLNLETNEIDYVGQTSMSFRKRDQNHRQKRQNGNRGPPFDYKLQAHPDKYIMIPLAYCDDINSLDLLETFYIYHFNTIDKDNYNWGGDTLRGKWNPRFRNDLDDEEIKKLYIEEELSIHQIGEKLETNATTISARLKKQGIKVQDKRIRDDLDGEKIKKLYIEEGLSIKQISKKLEASESTIRVRLKKQGIKVQSKRKAQSKRKIQNKRIRNDLDDEEIKKLYIEEKLSTIQIGKKLGTSDITISKRLKKQGIKIQDKRIRDDLDDEEIKKLYIEEKLSTIQIGKKLEVNYKTISRRLKKQGIKVQDKRIHNDLDNEEIKKLYIEKGLSTVQIGEKFGANPSTISRRLKKQGIKVSRNTSNYYRVSKTKTKRTKQGFTWVYVYPENNKIKRLYSVNFETLKKKVQAKGLPWYKINDR